MEEEKPARFFYTVAMVLAEKGVFRVLACDNKEEVCSIIRERWPWEYFPWYQGHTAEEVLQGFLADDDTRHDDKTSFFRRNGRIVFGHGEITEGDGESFTISKHAMDAQGKILY